MFMKKLIAFMTALVMAFSGGAVSVLKAADAEPIQATERTYRYDQDKLQLGVYCFRKDAHFNNLRRWFKEAGLNFAVCLSGEQFTDDDFTWLEDNGLGVFAPRTEYYRAIHRDAIWGLDYRDEPATNAFAGLAEGLKELYEEDANRFPLINLYPMYASGEQLGEEPLFPGNDSKIDGLNAASDNYRQHVAHYISTIDSDVISVDIYPLNVDNNTGKLSTYEYWLRNLDILADACRETGRDLWVVTQAAGNSKEEGGGKRWCNDPADQRWQDYVSLAFGAKALIYGCYYGGWWDQGSHMINNAGNRTQTYYAVKKVNEELSVFADVYGNYVSRGAVLFNGSNPNAAGAKLPLVKIDKQYQPTMLTAAPVLCGCFTEKEGDGSAYVFANMYEPETGKDASFTATFPGAESLTLYRMGEATEIQGDTLRLTLNNREGVFVTVNGGMEPVC
jgi:hypothetical protein